MGSLPRISRSLWIAIRFSRGRRRSGMTSLISLLSTLGIALGVAALIIGLSVMNGFKRELNQRILAVVPQGEIQPASAASFHDWPSLIPIIENVPGVIAAAPYIQFTGLIEHGVKLEALQIKGVDPQQESRLSALPKFVLGGAWQQFKADEQQIILGSGLAATLGVKQGDWVTLLIPNKNSEQQLLSPKRIRLQVVGLLQLSGQLDHSFAMVPLKDAQQYTDMSSDVTGIAIKVSDPFQADKVVLNAGEATKQAVYVTSWISRYGYMYNDIQMIKIIMYLAMTLVIGVACFNIVSTLVMAIKEKSTDIAILRTLGAQDNFIKYIFIWYGALRGLAGSVIGVILGVIVSLHMSSWSKYVEHWLGHSILSGNIYFIDFIPAELQINNVITVLVVAWILCLLASWYPARRASRLDPARVLSGI